MSSKTEHKLSKPAPRNDARDGVIAGLVAYLLWGLLPLYFKLVTNVGVLEVLAHRVIWAVPFGALIIHVRRQWPELWRIFGNRRQLALLAVSAAFIAINWYLYIWAVQHNEVFQASLGYYTNPLIYMLVGVMFFGERLRRLQAFAVALAALGVAVLTFDGGQFPAIALTLAVSFTVYGIIRKRVQVGAMPGLFVETLVLAPFALAWLLWAAAAGDLTFGNQVGMSWLLVLAGPVTVIPLLCFALAARRLQLTTLGFMQFIAPTLQFMIGIAYGEALTPAHIICFGCIWSAIVLFSIDAFRAQSKTRQTYSAPMRPE